jgi:multidrug efflux pump subunit AcrA (membrane-fusion protein)
MSKQLMKFLTAQTKHLALLSLGLSLFACGNKQQMNTNQVGEYAVTTLQTTSKELVNTYPATIKGKQDIEIRPNVSGFITRLCVDEGSVVRK